MYSKKNYKISIIVPAYNVEDYIEDCLFSIINQTYSNIEIIVINDGSSDNTGKIIDQIAKNDSRVKIIHKNNSGVSKTRLLGVTCSTGDYIGFVDADDTIELDMYEHLLNNAIKYKADISHCGFVRFFKNNHKDYYYGTMKKKIQINSQGVLDLLKGDFIEPGLWNKLYSSKLFKRVINDYTIDTSVKINEDLLINYYLFKESHLSIYDDVCLYNYRIRENSASTSGLNEQRLKDPLKVLEIIKKDCYDNIILYNIVFQRYVQQMNRIASMPLSNHKDLIKPYRKMIRKKLKWEFKSIMKNNISIKVKFFSLWIIILPMSYYCIHFLYEKLTKLDKKYRP